MGGLVGQVTYSGDLRDYLPLLALGELAHVGKGTVFGNGQYRIVGGSARVPP
jgi:CRISPR/Cas system endoribonuclease Cas6 (RAMP superfamily)